MEYQQVTDFYEGGEMSPDGLRITIKTIDGKVIKLQLKSKERFNTGTYHYKLMHPQYTHQSQIDRELAKNPPPGVNYNCETWNAYIEYLSRSNPLQLETYQPYWDLPITPTQVSDKITTSLQHYPDYNTKDFQYDGGEWNVILEISGKNVTLPLKRNNKYTNPGMHYDCPAKGPINYHLVVDNEIVLFVREIISTRVTSFKTPFPSNSRTCTTGEYDRYLFTKVKSGELQTKLIDVNCEVWNAYTAYFDSL